MESTSKNADAARGSVADEPPYEKAPAHVGSAAELVDALQRGELDVLVEGTIAGAPMLTLPPGATLRGGVLQFGGRGIKVTTDNTLADLRIETLDTEAAVLADSTVASLGTLVLRNVTTRGQIAIIAEGELRSGTVVAENVHVESADVRGRFDRPHNYGVDALQGGFTLWNRQLQASAQLSAELRDLSAGTSASPVRGSGVFVAGTPAGGAVHVSVLTTGPIETDGGIAAGTPDIISGGVFVVAGATVDTIENLAPVVTHGANDMVLDNWGTVSTWTARDRVTSHGPSGIGFVNFGDLGVLTIDGPLETFGDGARGFNLYDGTLGTATFASIHTHGDGAVGVQLDRDLPHLAVRGDLATTGSVGTSLVKGVQTKLDAMALSIQAHGRVDQLTVGGRISTAGANVTTIEVLGHLGQAQVDGGVHATGPGSVPLRSPQEVPALAGVPMATTGG